MHTITTFCKFALNLSFWEPQGPLPKPTVTKVKIDTFDWFHDFWGVGRVCPVQLFKILNAVAALYFPSQTETLRLVGVHRNQTQLTIGQIVMGFYRIAG